MLHEENSDSVEVAARFLPDCDNCFGTRCPRRCKMDGRSAGVLPALASGRAESLADCTVVAINAGEKVTSITCRIGKHEFEISARVYVLASGGLGSPSLLLRSTSEALSDGIGNRNDLVGRNLMLHLSEVLAERVAERIDKVLRNNQVRSSGRYSNG